jgi:CRISPR-associated protein Cmr1
MRGILAEYEITTPMFLGGGVPQDVDLRPPSIKGMLRFWWRAMKWGDCLKETDSELEALKKTSSSSSRSFWERCNSRS